MPTKKNKKKTAKSKKTTITSIFIRMADNGYILDIYRENTPNAFETKVFESSFDVIAYIDSNLPSPKDV